MDADAAAAEAMIIGQLAGKTYAQVLRLAEQAALTVDPALAERRREHAQKQARVSFFREQAGTAAISGRDLPPDEALAAMAAVNARAEEYKESGAFGDTPMDALRARAYLDLINGLPAAERIAIAEQQDDAAESLARALARAAQAQAAARAAADAKAGNGTRPDPDPDSTDSADSDDSADRHSDDDCDGDGQARANAGRPGGPGRGGRAQAPGRGSPECPDPARPEATA